MCLSSVDDAIKGQQTVMVVVAGNVRYENKSPAHFTQNFLITAQDAKWKVVSDCLRFQETLT